MVGRHHDPQCLLKGLRGIGEDFGHPRQGLLFLGVEHMKDDADEQRMAGFFPMGATLERAPRINQNVGDVLDVANFGGALAHLKKWIVPSTSHIGWIEQEAMRET